MPNIRHKVLVYITHGDRLLVFREPDSPEAGIQVPPLGPGHEVMLRKLLGAVGLATDAAEGGADV